MNLLYICMDIKYKNLNKMKKNIFIALVGMIMLVIAQHAQAQVVQKSVIGSANGHEYVNLGLPSGTLWATCNIGATKPEENGSYFAWGETKAKNAYNWASYKYANGNEEKLTKYCDNSSYGNNGFSDYRTILQADDDAAAVNWGNGWHMPTQEQWEELINNTTNKWTTQNGVKGYLFTAKNGQTLFLPAAGYRQGSKKIRVGSYGSYWSVTLSDIRPSCAWHLCFDSDFCNSYCFDDRQDGYPVRPVR